jgi:serine palmitoyltransferase
LEKTVAQYLSKEDAIIFGMGFATNSTAIPAIIGKGGLIISDSLNHASLVIGCRCSGATVRVFKHNDMKDLEHMLRIAVKDGQGGPHYRPWQKILIIVEGLYSMEGDIASLKEIVNLKKKYKAYLYVDEAHSIGALGKTGRGVCEYWGVPHKDVDVLMGTFTKSFASCGGYIAADLKTINSLRCSSFSSYYDLAMSPVCVQQALTALRLIMGKDGTTNGKDRIEALQRNSIFFRSRLKEKGFKVYGNHDSPVIPVILYSPMKVAAFSQLCLERKLAVVVVGYPATEILLARARFCMSASHTIEDLEFALEQIDSIADKIMIRYEEPLQATITCT